MSTRKHVVQVRGVRYRVLNNITIDFPSGLSVIAGANGSGKTSLMRLIAGLDSPESGEVRVLSERPERALRKGLIAVSLHPPYFDPALSVGEFLWLHKSLCRGEALEEAADRFNINNFINMMIYELSSGQRKRLDLTRVFSCLPRRGILLLDEPSESLDTASKSILVDLISKSLDIVEAVIVSTHDEIFAGELGRLGISSYVMLDNGKAHRVSLTSSGKSSVKPLSARTGESRGVSFIVKAIVHGRIPVSELRSIPGVLSVDFQPDIDWLLQQLGLDRSSLGNVILASTGKVEEGASGYSTMKLDSIMVRFSIVVEDYNALARVLGKLVEYGSIEYLSLEES